MRFDNGVTAKELQLERSLNKTAIDRNNSELENLSMALQQAIDENSNLKSKLREIGGGDKNAIATLQTELDKIKGELEEREVAIAKLKTELTAGEVKQLTLFPDQELTPSPEPEPEPTPSPEPVPITEPESTPSPSPEQKTKTKAKTKTKPKAAKKTQPEVLLLDSIDGTVAVGGLMEHLLDRKKQDPNFPDPPEKTQTFTDAVTGQTQRLNELENLYGFNLAGYVMKGQKREYRYKIS